MTPNLTPFEVVERLIGTPRQISDVLGYRSVAPFSWRHANGQRAAGDFPSTVIQRALLDHSDANKLGLTALHLIRGATEAEIDAILAARAAPDAAPAPVPQFTSRRRVAA